MTRTANKPDMEGKEESRRTRMRKKDLQWRQPLWFPGGEIKTLQERWESRVTWGPRGPGGPAAGLAWRAAPWVVGVWFARCLLASPRGCPGGGCLASPVHTLSGACVLIIPLFLQMPCGPRKSYSAFVRLSRNCISSLGWLCPTEGFPERK